MEDYLEKIMEQLNSGESKTIWRNISCIVIIGLTTSGREAWQEGGGNKKRYQYCTDSSGVILYLRSLQRHSGRNLIDLTLQDNVVVPSNFFQYIHHVGCAINLHSIINSGLIPGGQILSNRQTVFFLPVILHYKTMFWFERVLPIYLRIGCAFNLHSIINNGLIPGGENSSKRQTVFFLPIDPKDKGH